MIFGGWTRASQTLLCIMWAAAPLECASTRVNPRETPLATESAMDPPPAKSPPTDPNHGSRVQLNPNELILPQPDGNASEAVREFATAATHAVRQVYQADNDDPSVLLALQESLRDNADLKPLVPIWTLILQSSLARSESLQAVGPALRPIRESLRNAAIDPASQAIRGIDIGTGQNAFTSPIGRNRAIDGISATFVNLGTLNLGRVREACEAAAKAALEKARLPGRPAPANISRMVRKLYADAHLGGEVRKVSVVAPWHHDKAKKAMALRAAVGIVESKGNRGCTMARLAVNRSLRGKTSPALVEMGAREPILCSRLR